MRLIGRGPTVEYLCSLICVRSIAPAAKACWYIARGSSTKSSILTVVKPTRRGPLSREGAIPERGRTCRR